MSIQTLSREMLKVLGAIIAAVVLALAGAYVLREFKTSLGLIVGVILILLAIAIALPVQLKQGVTVFHDDVPDVVGDLAEAVRRREAKANEAKANEAKANEAKANEASAALEQPPTKPE